jgi:hypothetical protein
MEQRQGVVELANGPDENRAGSETNVSAASETEIFFDQIFCY